MSKALVFQCDGYERAHTRYSLVLIGAAVRAEAVPLQVAGQIWPVGTTFDLMGSTHTSAGFETLDFRGFEPMRYMGQFRDGDDTYALFKAGGKPADGFFAYHVYDFGLVWGTDARSGRVIEMSNVIISPSSNDGTRG